MTTTPIIDEARAKETKKIVGSSFPKVVDSFLGASPTYLNEIREGLAEQDLHKVASGAHTLKSSACQLGAARLSELAREIELIAIAPSVLYEESKVKLEKLFADLEDIHAQSHSELKYLCRK